MNGLIITNQEIGHNQYKIDRLIPIFNSRGIHVDTYVNDGTLATIKDGNAVINLPKADFVLYFDKDIYLAKLLEKAGYRLFDKPDFMKLCDDKVLTFIGCSNLGIRMPETFAGPLIYTDIQDRNLSFLSNIEKELGFPMIVKRVYGSLGEGVYKVNNHDELSKLYLEIYRNPVLFQKYIPSASGKSVRVLIIDGKVFGGFVRYNSGDFRSNFGSTADGEILSNPDKYFKFAQDVANKLDIEYAGIDLLDDMDGNPILCEINSNAFFEEFEKVTGLDVASAIVDMVIRKVS